MLQRILKLSCCLGLLVCTTVARGETRQMALLVGCTQYPNCEKIRPLHGPKNDIPLFASLLREKFEFTDDAITMLLDWPEEPSQRPTQQNITAAFESLIERATPESRIVILMAGHGCQVPVSAFPDPDLSEIDGLDEVFLPADVEPWSNDTLPNSIPDHQFGAWTRRMQEKGAHVWIIFDCCHSGTMLRSVGEDDSPEQTRRVLPEHLDIPAAVLPDNVETGEVLRSVDLPSRNADSTESPNLGSVTAFYAAQPFEETPELPRPSGAPRRPDYYYGLFSYMLTHVLQRQDNPLTYSELSQAVVNAYRSERGVRGPTPLFDGDLDRQVLGVDSWKQPSDCLLSRHGDTLQLNSGSVQGLTLGTVLAVRPPAGTSTGDDEILGYVRVAEVAALEAVAEPCDYVDRPAVAAGELPDQARCEIVWKDVGEMRVRLALRVPPGTSLFDTDLQTVIDCLPEEARALVCQEDLSTADWLLEVVTPERARESFGREISAPAVFLIKAAAAGEIAAGQSGEVANGTGTPSPPVRVHAVYNLQASSSEARAGELADQLVPDLKKLFTWQNIWRVSDHLQNVPGSSDLNVSLQVISEPKVPRPVENPTELYAGERIEIRIANEGLDDWWVGLFYLDADLGITKWVTGSIKARKSFKPLRAIVDQSTSGPEGFVLFAVPLARQRLEPNFDFLEQDALGSVRTRNVSAPPETPFGRLLHGAAQGRNSRGVPMQDTQQPVVIVRTWTTKSAGP